MGAAARLAVKAGVAEGTAFGLKRREQDRKVAREARSAFWARSRSLGRDWNLRLLSEDTDLQKASLSTVVRLARQQARFHQELLRSEQARARECLAEFEQGVGLSTCKDLKKALPCLQDFSFWQSPLVWGHVCSS